MLEFRLLGPVELRVAGRVVDTGPLKRQAVLALLLLEAGTPLSIDTLIDRLWDHEPPQTASSVVYAHLSRIRGLFGRLAPEARQLVSLDRSAAGYRLGVDPDCIDLHRSQRLGRQTAGGEADQEAALWEAVRLWGEDPLAGLPGEWFARLRERLRQQRLDLLVRWAGLASLLGYHTKVIDALRPSFEDHQLAEPVAVMLMRALHATQRSAEALDCFSTVRRRLAEELGTDPGPELQQLHQAILRGEPGRPRLSTAETAVPAQLPLAIHGFTGRARELDRLDAILESALCQPASAVVAAITGTAGVGKTALAVHWAHRVRDRFPHGQLYLNLQGYAASATVRPIDALTSMLIALGRSPHGIPTDVEQAAAMYRSLLADRPMLILLDNAANADQIRPLLPGSAGCVILVTSRHQLGGLVVSVGAQPIRLDSLSHAEAALMLRRIVGDRRARAEPEAIAQLAVLCGHLPLALRVAAANLAVRPEYTAAEYARQLRTGSRLDGLTVVGDDHNAPRAAFDVSYAALAEPSRRLFRLLALIPGPDLTVPAAAAAGGLELWRASDLVRLLAAAHLLDESAAGRFTFHDLIRLYAAERACDAEPAQQRNVAIVRRCQYYLQGLDAAADLLYPHLIRLPVPPVYPGCPSITFAGDAEALAWLEAERANLVALVTHTAPREWAWRLSDAARGFFYLRMYASDWARVAAAASTAAEADGQPQARAAAHLGLGTLAWRQGRYREALDRNTQALALAEEAQWQQGRMAALGSIANVLRQEGQLDEAAGYYRRVIALGRQLGLPAVVAVMLGNLGLVHQQYGCLPEAARSYREALNLLRETNSPSGEATLIANLGEVLHGLGRNDEAVEHLETALRLHQSVGHTAAQGDTLRCLAAVHLDTGRIGEAIKLAEQALAHARDAGHPFYEATALGVLGRAHCRIGEYERGLERCREALETASRSEQSDPRIAALLGISEAYGLLGRLTEARSYVDQALALARRTGHRLLEAKALTGLAEWHSAAGEPEAARECGQTALAMHTESGFRQGQERTRALLHTLA